MSAARLAAAALALALTFGLLSAGARWLQSAMHTFSHASQRAAQV